jgi:hypothetical protein
MREEDRRGGEGRRGKARGGARGCVVASTMIGGLALGLQSPHLRINACPRSSSKSSSSIRNSSSSSSSSIKVVVEVEVVVVLVVVVVTSSSSSSSSSSSK